MYSFPVMSFFIKIRKEEFQKTSSINKTSKHPPFFSDILDRLQLKNMTSAFGHHNHPKHMRQKVYKVLSKSV